MVTSTRQSVAIEDVDSNISVITDQDIKTTQAQNLKDVFAYQPGVNFESTGRVGVKDVRIRGIGDGRVLVRVDGMTLPDAYEFGPFQKSGRQRFDVANIKQAEIIRGPGSTLYGSRAIGGVVSFTTKDPEDYLADGKTVGGNVNIGYSGINNSKNAGATVAGQFNDKVSAMLSVTHRKFNETKIHSGLGGTGATREQNNPEDNNSTDVLAKMVFEPNDNHRFTFSGTLYQANIDADVLSSKGVTSFGTTTHSYTGEDKKDRKALSIRHDFTIDTAVADDGFWQLSYQDNKAVNDNTLVRTARGLNYTEYKHDVYQSDSIGLEAQLNKAFNTGSVSHDLAYGVSYTQQDLETLRTNTRVTARGTTVTSESNFPNSTVKELGFFIQDRIGFADGKFELIPGLRYDSYKINAQNNAAYSRASGNIAPRNFSASRLSFKLGGLYHINDVHTLFANYNQGFRAPAFNDANVGFANPARGYGFIPNPDLKPETSEGFELGWRAESDWGHSSLSAFYTQYDNFIAQTNNFNPRTRLIEFQNINLDKTEIYGLEFSGGLDLHNAFNAPQGLKLKGSLAYAKGKDKNDGQPLSEISPLTAVVGLAYDSPTEKWGAEGLIRAVAAKNDSDINAADLNGGTTGTGGYATLDLLGYYNINKSAKINVGIYNVFDKKYTTWETAKSIATASRNSGDTEPGRYFAASFSYDF